MIYVISSFYSRESECDNVVVSATKDKEKAEVELARLKSSLKVQLREHKKFERLMRLWEIKNPFIVSDMDYEPDEIIGLNYKIVPDCEYMNATIQRNLQEEEYRKKCWTIIAEGCFAKCGLRLDGALRGFTIDEVPEF